MQQTLIKFKKAKLLLQEGDILLFRGSGIISSLIQRASEGKYSHVGVASGFKYRNAQDDTIDTIWECVEFREWKGGRSVNLEEYIKVNNGKIDVYRPSPTKNVVFYDYIKGIAEEKIIYYNGAAVTRNMRLMTGLPYGWKRIWWIAQHKLPILRTLYDLNKVVDDRLVDLVYPVCSTAISYSASKTNYDFVHHRADAWMEPSDIARSALIHYLFTLVE